MAQRLWTVAIIVVVACSHGDPCDVAFDAHDWAGAFAACSRPGSTPEIAVKAATAASFLGKYDDVTRIATPILLTPRANDARSLLGQVAFQTSASGALPLLFRAFVGHTLDAEGSRAARDAHQLAGVWYQLGDYNSATRWLEIAHTSAATSDRQMQLYVDIALADIHRTTGDIKQADLELDRAVRDAPTDDDKNTARLKQAQLYLELGGRDGLAHVRFEEVLVAERARPSPRDFILQSALLNLAFIDRVNGDVATALAEVEAARAAHLDDLEYHLNRGLVLADSNKPVDAEADLAAAEQLGPQGRLSWWVPFQHAQLLVRTGDRAKAILSDRRAIAAIAQIAAVAGPQGALLVGHHRAPYEHLVGILAADHAWNDVVDVIAAMDAASVIDVIDERDTVVPTSTEQRAYTSRITRQAANAADVAAAWREQPLVIAIEDGHRVWRITIEDGAIHGDDVGDSHSLVELATRLASDPSDAAAADSLGDAMLPRQLHPSRSVAVLAIGSLARVPLASLRWQGRRAIEQVPLVRASGLVPRDDDHQFDADKRIVLGDSLDDLPEAREEARTVASRLHGTAFVGAEATPAAFASARGAMLLHIAGHTDGAVLPLHGGNLRSDPRSLLAAHLVVLASCSAAVGRDDAGTGSLARGFLDAGSDIVLASRWSIADAEARLVIEDFYDNDGMRSPARALARAQLDASKTLPVQSWSGFEIWIARPRRVTAPGPAPP